MRAARVRSARIHLPLAGMVAGLALRHRGFPEALRPVAWVYALVAVFAWITLEVRLVYHPGAMSLVDSGVEDGELWAWSGAWMGYDDPQSLGEGESLTESDPGVLR